MSKALLQGLECVDNCQHYSKISLGQVLLFLLLTVLIGALEIPDWILLITNSPLPSLGREYPYWLPILCVIAIFNIRLLQYSYNQKIYISAQSLSFFVFIVVLFFIELGHVIFENTAFSGVFIFSLLWMFVFYSVLMLFNGLLIKARSWVVALSLALISFICLCDVVMMFAFSDGRGAASDWLNNNLLFDSTYLAYLALFGVLLVLFEWPIKLTGHLDYLIRAGLLLFLIGVICLHRLAGPELMLLAILVFKFFVKLRALLPKLVPASLLLLFIGLLISFNGLYQNPTAQGLHGGLYLFDEIGFVHGDIISSFIRRESMIQALQLFSESSIFGVGVDAVTSIKVISLGLHSSFVYILASFGLMGFFFFSLWMYLSLGLYWQNKKISSLPLIFYLSGLSLLMPTIFWWFAIIFYLFTSVPTDLLTIDDISFKSTQGKDHDD